MQDHPNTAPVSTSLPGGTCPASSLGASFNPLSEQYLANPYTFFAQARQAEPVFFSPMLNAWVVSCYDDVKAILYDPKRFSSVGTSAAAVDLVPAAQAILEQGVYKHALTCSLINVDPPQHTRLRASLTEKGFSPPQAVPFERQRLGVLA